MQHNKQQILAICCYFLKKISAFENTCDLNEATNQNCICQLSGWGLKTSRKLYSTDFNYIFTVLNVTNCSTLP